MMIIIMMTNTNKTTPNENDGNDADDDAFGDEK